MLRGRPARVPLRGERLLAVAVEQRRRGRAGHVRVPAARREAEQRGQPRGENEPTGEADFGPGRIGRPIPAGQAWTGDGTPVGGWCSAQEAVESC